MINDIFLDILPKIDLHGYDRESARVAVLDFVLENKILNNKQFIIIHGIGNGIVKDAVHQTLNKSKDVLEFKVVSNNLGCTIVKIK